MNRILIIQTAFIGDVILATPVLEKLKQKFPEAKIDFLVRQGNESLLKEHPHINQLLIWNKRRSKYKNLLKIIQTVRATKYDLVVNLQRFFASGLITAFSASDMRIGFSKNPLSFLFDKKYEHNLRGLHETNRNLSLVQDITDKKYIRPKLYPRKYDYANIAKYQGLPYLCIAPTSVWTTKEFPQVKWVELIISLNDNWIIYLLGGPGDFEACEEIRVHTERHNVVNLAGKLNLLASAALMEKAAMNYVNDSAPLHMTSAMNAPCNAVYCSTKPSFGFGPLSINSKVIETDIELACKPCGLHGKKECPLGHFDCGHTIDMNHFSKPEYQTS
jgi:heptosyltransferase-2